MTQLNKAQYLINQQKWQKEHCIFLKKGKEESLKLWKAEKRKQPIFKKHGYKQFIIQKYDTNNIKTGKFKLYAKNKRHAQQIQQIKFNYFYDHRKKPFGYYPRGRDWKTSEIIEVKK